MNDAPLNNPHDAFIKAGLGNPQQMASFLKAYLPPTLTADIDWSSLQSLNTDFIDEQLHQRHADLLFLSRFHGKPIFFYLLFEHQRSLDPWMPLRMLGYQVRIWENYRKIKPHIQSVPAIIPIVFFQGRRKWTISPYFRDLLELPACVDPAWLEYFPDFRHATVNLSDLPLQPIEDNVKLRVMVKVLRAILEPDAANAFTVGYKALQELSEVSDQLTFFRICLTYLTHAGNTLDRETFYTIIKQSKSTRFREEAMTIAEQLIQEGRVEGREEGRQEGEKIGQIAGERLILERLLTRKFGALPFNLSERLNHANQDELERWGERILDAKTLGEVFDQ